MPLPHSGNAPSTTSSNPSSTAPALRSRLAAARRWLLASTRYHGIWTPGVRLLRGIDLQRKALVLLACIALPMVGFTTLLLQDALAWQAESRRLAAGLDDLRALAGLTRSARALQFATARQDHAERHESIADLARSDQALFEPFMAGLQQQVGHGRTGARHGHGLEALAARRTLMLASLATRPAPGGQPQAGPRAESLDGYVDELARLNVDIARSSGLASNADPDVHHLQQAATVWLPRLGRLLGRSLSIEPPPPQADGRSRQADDRLVRLLVEAHIVISLLRPSIEDGGSAGLLDAAVLAAPLAAVQRYVDAASRLADGAADAGGAAASSGHIAGGVQAGAAADDLAQAVLAALTRHVAALDAGHRSRAAWQLALLCAWLLSAAYLAVCTYKVVGGGVRTLCAQLERMGRGDLAPQPQGRGSDEIGRALSTLGSSVGRMSQLFEAVTQGVAAVAHASREVATGNSGLADRTNEIRGLIAEVAQRTQTFSGSMDVCGQRIEEAAGLIHEMRDNAKRGRKAMAGLRERMNALQGKSRQIAEVVGLVEAVAYQTRMLSINASVEAARAGAAGRGFAVVAEEVRALAQRSQTAAQRIAEIVGASIEEIEGGVMMTERADEAVRDTDHRSDALNGLMQEVVQVTRAGRTQSQQVLDIARSVEESVAGTTRAIQQLAEASSALRTQGDGLKRSTRHFVFR